MSVSRAVRLLAAATILLALAPGIALAQNGTAPEATEPEAPDAAPDEDGASDDEPEPVESGAAVFEMKDGARLIGPVEVATLKIETSYGMLEVPVREIYSVRFGRRCDPKLLKRIADLVAQLGDGDFTVREKATEALVAIGPSVRPELEEALQSNDLEVKTRARKIIDKIEKKALDGGEEVLELDEILTAQFPIRGCVKVESFRVRTKYGPLTVHKSDVVQVQFHEPPRLEKTVEVSADASVKGQWEDTGIDVQKGWTVRVIATGQVGLRNYGVTVGPDGQAGNSYVANLPIGCLVGKVGGGQMFQLGAKGSHEAAEGGRLQLALAAPSNRGNTGSFKVKVIVEKPVGD